MYTLYWERMSGAIGPQALLEEIGAPYRIAPIDMAAGEHREPAYRRINPLMRVPALALPGGTVVGETSAITLVLAERHPEAGLVPAPGDNDRPEFLFWLIGMATNGYPLFSRAWHPEQFTLDDSANETVRLVAERQLDEFFTIIENAIRGDACFMQRGFTALDIYVAMLTEWTADKHALFRKRPKLAALYGTVSSRPSYRKVMDQHSAPAPALAEAAGSGQ